MSDPNHTTQNQIALLKLAHKMALNEVAQSTAQKKLLLDFLQEEHGKEFRRKLENLMQSKDSTDELDCLLHKALDVKSS